MAQLPITEQISEKSTRRLVETLAEIEYENFYPQRGYANDHGFRKESWDLIWTPVSSAERDTILSFFDTHSLVVPFEWFAFNDTQERSWIFSDVPTTTNIGGDQYTIKTKLLEEFTV